MKFSANLTQEGVSTIDSSSASKAQSSSKNSVPVVDISKPTVLRIAKSLSDLSQPKRKTKQLTEHEYGAKKAKDHLSDDLEFDSWYNDQRQDLLDASQGTFR
jgi:hypothetical protein